MSSMLKNLAFYIGVALETKGNFPNYHISDKECVKLAINLDNYMAYGLSKIDRKRFLKVIGRMFK